MPFIQTEDFLQPFAVPSPFTNALDMDHPNPQPTAQELNLGTMESQIQNGTTMESQNQNGTTESQNQNGSSSDVTAPNLNLNLNNETNNLGAIEICTLLCGGTKISL
mmetsp:Transcript_10419/g.13647  ORF Transcript_10419/g.13647 Transcript_10419/m.13647 type:complete len:107 (+) Transcript_10419:2722-3042(+)